MYEIYMKTHMTHLTNIALFPEMSVAHMYVYQIIV